MTLKNFINSTNEKFIRIQSLDRVDSLIANFVSSGGKDNLQIIADFDYTLTNYHRSNGKPGRGNTSWEFLDESNLIPGYFEEVKRIINKYRPVEVNPKLSIEDKTAAMLNAYDEVNQLISKYNFSNELMDTLIKESKIELRLGVKDFLRKAYAMGIPVLIVTAGLGDVVQRLLKKHDVYVEGYTNVMGNFIDMESSDGCQGLIKPYLHVYNKNGQLFLDRAADDIKKKMTSRQNILLLGDSIGDLGMSDGIYNEEKGSLLRIGFLNHNIEDVHLLEQYQSSYDVVLLDERTYELPNYILDVIAQKH